MDKAAKGALLATLEIDRNSGVPIYRQIDPYRALAFENEICSAV